MSAIDLNLEVSENAKDLMVISPANYCTPPSKPNKPIGLIPSRPNNSRIQYTLRGLGPITAGMTGNHGTNRSAGPLFLGKLNH